MSEANFLAGQSSIWVQPDGPNTEPQYLGCHGIGDVDEPVGDRTLLYCPDRSQAGEFEVKNSFRGEPGSVTFTIETDMRKTADYLEDLKGCGVPIYVHKLLGGRRDTFTNFDRTFVFYPSYISSKGIGNFAARQPGDENETTQSFEIAADEMYRMFGLEASRVSIVDTEDVTGIAVCGEERCEGDVGVAQTPEDYIFLGTKALAASAANVANVLASINGSNFAATAADPFGGGEDIQGIVCFRVGRDTIRVLVARGTTDGANPAEIAYSDDNGATWTNVDVGSTNGEYVSNGHALFALDRYHIWLGTDGGRIYFSNDGGLTWTVQENASISATDVVGISFIDTDIGYALYTGGETAKTSDGSASGATWSAATAVGVAGQLDLHAVTQYLVWAAGSNGLYYTADGGVTWTLRDSTATGAVDFFGALLGVMAGSAASGPLKQTVDGGYDWSTMTTVANAGFTDVHIISTKLGYVVGAAQGGTGFVAKIQPET